VSGRAGVEARSDVVRRALRNGDLRRVLAAFLMFNIVEWATWIALLVWGYGYDGVRGASAIALVQLGPGALLAAPAAALLGRIRRGRALCVGYAAQCVAFLAVGIALLADLPGVVVAVTAIVSSVSIDLTRPVHHALLPEISHTTGDLTAGNAASGSLEAVASFVGPLASGILIALWGPGGVMVAMSGCAFVAVLLTVRLVTAAPLRRDAADGTAAQPMRAVLRHPAARLMSLLIAAEFVLLGMTDILLVVLALDVLGMADSGPGILTSAVGVGGLAGAALALVLIGRQHLATPLVLGAVGAGVAFALTGLATTPVVALLLIALSSSGKLFYDVASRTFIQRLLPDHLLTAMFGIQESLANVALALGTLAAPALVGALGARGAFVGAGLFLPVVALATYRPLRRLDLGAAVPADVLALLMSVPIVAVLAPRIVERLARDAVAVTRTDGEYVVRQGDPGDRFYVIATGRVEVDIDGTDIRGLGPGDWFGEIALLRDVPRTASVRALTGVSLWAIDRDSFLASVAAASQSVAVADNHIRDRYV
jgi:hypothetical protein